MSLFDLFTRRDSSGDPTRVEPVLNADPVPVSGITPGTPAYEWFAGSIDGSGKSISEKEALGVSAVYACVSLIGGAVASLPLHVYRRTEEGRERVNNDLWWLLNEQMSTVWPAAVGWEFGMQSLLLHGDLFMRLVRASRMSPNIIGIVPVHPLLVDVRKIDGRMVYVVNEDGIVTAYDQDDMIHVPGPGFNGFRGMSQISYVLRQPANIARDAGDQASNVLDAGMRPDLALISKNNTPIKSDQVTLMRDQWVTRYSGKGKSTAPIVLSGMDIKELSLTAADAQLLETRSFQIEDIARVFGVPPFMIGQTDKTTSWGSGVEHMGIGFTKYTLQRHLVKIEQEFNRKCFKTARHFSEFDTKGLERGDIKTRTDSYRAALGRAGEPGWMSVNEIRRAENMPPVDGGDEISKGVTNGQQQNPPTAGQ